MTRWTPALLFALCAGLTGIARAQGTAQKQANSVEALKQEVIQFEAARNRALVKNDAKKLATMYADGLIWTNPRGQRLTRDQILAEMKAGTEKFIVIHHKDRQVRVYGDTDPKPTRTTVQVAALAHGALIEISAIAVKAR